MDNELNNGTLKDGKLTGYECALCHETFDSERWDHLAREEYEATFGRPFDQGDIAVLCDVCFNKVMIGEGSQ